MKYYKTYEENTNKTFKRRLTSYAKRLNMLRLFVTELMTSSARAIYHQRLILVSQRGTRNKSKTYKAV